MTLMDSDGVLWGGHLCSGRKRGGLLQVSKLKPPSPGGFREMLGGEREDLTPEDAMKRFVLMNAKYFEQLQLKKRGFFFAHGPITKKAIKKFNTKPR